MPSTESVTVLALVNTGSRFESPTEEGIAHFFEHMVFKGTRNYPESQDLSIAVDSVGADFNAFTSKEYTGYYVKSAAKHLRLALDIVSDMIMAPLLRQDDIDKEKGVIIEELNMYYDSPSRYIGDLFDRMAYLGSGLSHDIIGNPNTINSFGVADFKRFLNYWYGLGNMTLVIAGSEKVVNDPATIELAKEMFAKDPAQIGKEQVSLDPYLKVNSVSDQKFHLEYRNTQQAHLVMGWPALRRTDPSRFALSLLSIIMGGNMSSRLFSEVRENRGLSYYISSGIDQYHDTGMLEIVAGVDPHRTEEAVRVALAESEAIVDGSKKVTEIELQRAKDYLTGKMILGFEDSESVAQYYGLKQLLMGQVETPDKVMEKINAVTLEDISAVAEKVLKADELRMAVIGPFKEDASLRQFVA